MLLWFRGKINPPIDSRTSIPHAESVPLGHHLEANRSMRRSITHRCRLDCAPAGAWLALLLMLPCGAPAQPVFTDVTAAAGLS